MCRLAHKAAFMQPHALPAIFQPRPSTSTTSMVGMFCSPVISRWTRHVAGHSLRNVIIYAALQDEYCRHRWLGLIQSNLGWKQQEFPVSLCQSCADKEESVRRLQCSWNPMIQVDSDWRNCRYCTLTISDTFVIKLWANSYIVCDVATTLWT